MTAAIDISAIRVAERGPALEVAEPEAITAADLQLFETSEKKARIRPLQRITERHHAAARLIAMGLKTSAVSVITGYASVTLNALRDDPSFEELISFYSLDLSDEYQGMKAQLLGMGSDALAVLRERLENEPEKIAVKDLMGLVQLVADRTGHGPSSTSVNVDVKVGLADKMRNARDRARELSAVARDITPGAAE